jgi:hypothetical protein
MNLINCVYFYLKQMCWPGVASSMSMRFVLMKYVYEINEQYSRKRVVDFIGLRPYFLLYYPIYYLCSICS